MWLILADDTDTSAHWMYHSLKHWGIADLQLVSSSAVAYNLFWNYRMSSDLADSQFIFGDGRKLRTDGITGIINRLSSIPTDKIRGPFISGRQSEKEQMAYFVSWMYSLPVPVINRPSSYKLTGAWRDASDWAILAATAGLHPAPFCRTAANNIERAAIESKLAPFEMQTQTVYVVANRVIGTDVPKSVADGCVKMANIANCELLGFEFVTNSPRSWLVAGVSAYPELHTGGEPLIDAIYQFMVQRSLAVRACAS